MTVGKDVSMLFPDVVNCMQVSFTVRRIVSQAALSELAYLSGAMSTILPLTFEIVQTDDLELKKLVYLYLINYAKTQPDLAIMGVNTFVKVSAVPNAYTSLNKDRLI